jgi:hypothetical protein
MSLKHPKQLPFKEDKRGLFIKQLFGAKMREMNFGEMIQSF